ncbi:hypothetical protein BG004_000347 [Podila humilis]|nr:hypothetical protein BG004_000347 [Podila humilis]
MSMPIEPPSHLLASPENVRTIFFTNLVLLGVQAHSSQAQLKQQQKQHQPQQGHRQEHNRHESPSCTAQNQVIETRDNFSSEHTHSSHELPLQKVLHSLTSSFEPNQTIVIDSLPGGSGTSRPLELTKHVFSRGHQSTKALEFILWFLLSRLDQQQARDRFKGCWPVLDRHDAREFRNVAFKWMEELRKDGCFNIGHNMDEQSTVSLNGDSKVQDPNHQHQQPPLYQRSRASSISSTTSVSTPGRNLRGGLGVFMPTIRRSYLDESIGERLEQLVLILSTYVLAQVVKHEALQKLQRSGQDKYDGDNDIDTELVRAAGMTAPETRQEEEQFQKNVDSQTRQWDGQCGQIEERYQEVSKRLVMESEEAEMKLRRMDQELITTKKSRESFYARHPSIGGQSKGFETDQGKEWAGTVVDHWQPFFGFVEQRVVSEARTNGMSDGRRVSERDVSLVLDHLIENAGMARTQNDSYDVDLVKVLKSWKRSLQTFGVRQHTPLRTSEGDYSSNLRAFYQQHVSTMHKAGDSKAYLQKKLNESSRRVERLQREQTILKWPYRRVLTTIPSTDVTPISAKPRSNVSVESVEDAEQLSKYFAKVQDDRNMADGPSGIRKQIRLATTSLEHEHSQPLLMDLGNEDKLELLSIPAIAIQNVPAVAAHLRPASHPRHAHPLPVMSASTQHSLISKPVTPPSLSASLWRRGPRLGASTTQDSSFVKIPVTKPSPADLVTSHSLNHGQSYEAICKDVVSSLTVENDNELTSTKPKNNGMKASTLPTSSSNDIKPTISKYTPMASKHISPFLASILRTTTRPKATTLLAEMSLKEKPQASTPAPVESASVENGVSRVSISNEAGFTTPPLKPSGLQAKRFFSPRLGSSKKRRQSSEFSEVIRSLPGKGVASTEGGLVIRHKVQNPFEVMNGGEEDDDDDDDDCDMPETPSKRRRMDLYRPLLALQSKELSDNTNLIQSSSLFMPKTPFTKTAKLARSTALTLNDLRDPTPKAVKVRDFGAETPSGKQLPIMFLHTPQRKQLFERKAAGAAIPSMAPLSTPSPSKPTHRRTLDAVEPITPSKKSTFGSSIFSRFNLGSTSERREKNVGYSPEAAAQKWSSVPNRAPSTNFMFSPKSPNLSSVAKSKQPVGSQETVDVNVPSLSMSSTVNRLLSGNSIALDRIGGPDHQDMNSSGSMKPGMITSSDMSPLSAAPGPMSTKALDTELRHFAGEIAVSTAMMSTPLASSISDQASSNTKSNSNPWGRPPSWKPKSPRMIDMEKKRLAERAARLAKKTGLVPFSLEPHSTQALGSLKTSVFGRPGNMVSSMSSLSSRSTYSGMSSSSVYNKSVDMFPVNDSLQGAEEEEGEEEAIGVSDDDDTGRISPTAVSPIRGADLFRQSTFQPFSSMFLSRAPSPFAQSAAQSGPYKPLASVAHAPSKTAVPKATEQNQKRAAAVGASVSALDTLVAASVTDPTFEEERRRMLEGPIEEFESRYEEKEENETVMNTALRSIFGQSTNAQAPRNAETPRPNETPRALRQSQQKQQQGHLGESQGSAGGSHFHFESEGEVDGIEGRGGLFDEGMPDALDLDEALWENTEVFS